LGLNSVLKGWYTKDEVAYLLKTRPFENIKVQLAPWSTTFVFYVKKKMNAFIEVTFQVTYDYANFVANQMQISKIVSIHHVFFLFIFACVGL